MQLSNQDLKLLETWIDDPTFKAWARGTGVGAGDVRWKIYFARHPELHELGDIGRQLVIGLPFPAHTMDAEGTEAALAKTLDRLSKEQRKLQMVYRSGFRWAAYAASLLLLVALAWWGYRGLVPTEVVLTTDFGETVQTELPDGSVVVLNAASRIMYNKDQPRRVYLSGEAYFEVTKRPSTGEKFEVITHDLTVTALGTAFNVSQRREATAVYLEEGKVQLSLHEVTDSVGGGREKNPIRLTPGQSVTYSSSRRILSPIVTEDAQVETSWKEGTVLYRATNLREIIDGLETIYGITFTVSDSSMLERDYTIGLPNDNLPVALEGLRRLLGASIVLQKDSTYRIAGPDS